MKKTNKYEILLIYTIIRKILELNLKFNNSYSVIEIFTFGLLLLMIISDMKKSKCIVKKSDTNLLNNLHKNLFHL